MLLWGPGALSHHGFFEARIQERWLLLVGEESIDVEAILRFNGIPSAGERERMDGDGDGTISELERKRYTTQAAHEITLGLNLEVDGNAVDLVRFYNPETDLLGKDLVGRHPHILSLSLSACTDGKLAPGSRIELRSVIRPGLPSIRRFTAVTRGNAPPIEIVNPPMASRGTIGAVEVVGRGGKSHEMTRSPGTVAGSALLLSTARAAATALDGAPDLIGALLRDHRYLLAEPDRSRLETTLRDLRQSKSAADRVSAEDRTLSILGAVPRVVHLVSKGGEWVVPGASIDTPGDVGAVLFRIDCGPGRVRCRTATFDLRRSPSPHVDVDIEAGGTTWLLLGLRNVPPGETSMTTSLRIGDTERLAIPVRIVAPPSGRLKLTVLSAETNRPIPVMLRLDWKVDGTSRRPSSALDFMSQLDHNGGYGPVHDVPRDGRLPSQLYGWGGFYWCVPRSFDMSVPPGDWEVVIRRGAEHVPIKDSFTVRSGGTVEKTYRLRRWIDMPARGWYSGDDHVHFQILNDSDAERLMAYAMAEDVHVSNILQMGDISRTWFQQRGFGEAYRVIDGDYALVPGQECPRTHGDLGIGHYVGLNIDAMVRDPGRYFLYDWVYDSIRARGGLSGYPHFAYEDEGGIEIRSMSIYAPLGKIDFASLMQDGRLGTRHYFDFADLGFKIPASAGSDVPWSRTIGEVRLYAYCGDGPFEVDAWFEALKSGRTFVTSGPMLELDVEGVLPGDELRVVSRRKLRVRARSLGSPERGNSPAKLEILRHGEVIRSVKASEKNQEELALDFEIDSEFGFWIAARTFGSDGSKAFTTPVYVVRDGFRFWNLGKVEEIVERRLRNLEEVEQIVSRAIKKGKGRKVEGHELELRQLIAQGPELLKRVEEARVVYRNLVNDAVRERARRK